MTTPHDTHHQAPDGLQHTLGGIFLLIAASFSSLVYQALTRFDAQPGQRSHHSVGLCDLR